MATSNPADILLAVERWATRNVIEACDAISHEQFHQTFEMGVESLHNTTTHILGALRGWADVLAEREPRIRLEEAERTPEELKAIQDEVADEFESLVRAHPLDGIVEASRQGRSFTFTRGGILTHVTTHGFHHRAQCLNMLRHLGVEKLPPVSGLEWMLMVDGAAV